MVLMTLLLVWSKKESMLTQQRFNKLAADAETVIIDMRNHYEYEVGHFENAIEIPSDTFREQLPIAAEMMQADEKKHHHVLYRRYPLRKSFGLYVAQRI